ncbi:MAG: CsgG/HfaB family protein [Synergistaceae bacterium]|jgi:curli biogenesis system outer membrane secretion channel CsgG|nr:CsgG/HfaB family protein [Synergistaceae bacterium]
MKKINFITLLLLLCVLLSSRADARPTLAVRAFDNKAERGTDVPAQAITDMMTTELYNAGLFSLVEREKLDYVAEEQRLAQSGLMDPSTAPQAGMVKGARYSMTGAITVYYYNASGGIVYVPGIAGGGAGSKTAYVTLDIRIVDNSTSEVIYAAAEQGEAKREASGLITRFGGFASVSYGGILATATRDSVIKHVETMQKINWQE